MNEQLTKEDRERNLVADYEIARREDVGIHDDGCLLLAYLGSGAVCDCGLDAARTGWPAAIRRALAAEAEVERLLAVNAKLREALENYLSSINEDNAWPCNDDHGGIWIDCQGSLVQELATAAEEALEGHP